MDEASLMWKGWLDGAYGTLGDSLRQYQLFIQLHFIRENFISANKKNYKPKKPPPYEQFDYMMASFLNLEQQNAHNRELQNRVLNMFGETDAGNDTNKGLQRGREESTELS